MGTSCHQDKHQKTYRKKTFHARKDRKNSNEKCRAVVLRQPLFAKHLQRLPRYDSPTTRIVKPLCYLMLGSSKPKPFFLSTALR